MATENNKPTRKRDTTLFREQVLSQAVNEVLKKLIPALEGLGQIAEETQDLRLKADIYEYMIDRALGKSRQSIDVLANVGGEVKVKPLTVDQKYEILQRVAEKYGDKKKKQKDD